MILNYEFGSRIRTNYNTSDLQQEPYFRITIMSTAYKPTDFHLKFLDFHLKFLVNDCNIFRLEGFIENYLHMRLTMSQA